MSAPHQTSASYSWVAGVEWGYTVTHTQIFLTIGMSVAEFSMRYAGSGGTRALASVASGSLAVTPGTELSTDTRLTHCSDHHPASNT